MSDNYQIEAVDQPAWAIIGGGISAYNKQQAGRTTAKTIVLS